MGTIMAVDKDRTFHEQRIAEWAKYEIGAVRVDTMHEAITRLINGGEFLFVVINEDTIVDFTEQLPVMRDITNTPIFVFTNSYTIKKKIKAMELGADMYDPHNTYVKDDVLEALEILKVQNRWATKPPNHLPLLVCGDIILSPLRRSVFVRDVKISLTKIEFDILEYLMINDGIILTHTQILRTIWGGEHGEISHDVLWSAIKRLREKLRVSPGSPTYIVSEREIGYCFSHRTAKG